MPMSYLHIVNFINKIFEDPVFQAKYNNIKIDKKNNAMKQIILIASRHGYIFNEKELKDLCLLLAVTEAENKTGKDFNPQKLSHIANDAGILQSAGKMKDINQKFFKQFRMLEQNMQSQNQLIAILSSIIKANKDKSKSEIENLR